MGARNSKRRPRAGTQDEAEGGAEATRGPAGGGKRYSPEERRQAVEAYQKAGLTQKAFAAQWGISAVTLGNWLRKHGEEGPQGLERMAAGAAKRRGRPPLAAPVREEVVSVQRRFPVGCLNYADLRIVQVMPSTALCGVARTHLDPDRRL